MPLEYEDRPAIGESYGGAFTWRALVIRFVVAFGVLASLSAAIFVYILLHQVWLDASRKRAEPLNTGPALQWSGIPDISSLQITDRNAITVSSRHLELYGIEANGDTYTFGRGAININTGKMMELPGEDPNKPMPLTIQVGEGFAFYLNMMGHPGVLDEIEYKLVSIIKGVCVFDMTQRMRERALKTIIVAPYAADSNQQQAGFPKPPTLGSP